MKKILFCMTILSSSLGFSKDDCRPAALEKAKKAALEIFLEQSQMSIEEINYSLREGDGGLTDCCWTHRALVIKSKDENEKTLAKYNLAAGNQYGEYQKGICESRVNNYEAEVRLSDVEYCKDKAETLSHVIVSRLAKVEAIKSEDNLKSEDTLEHTYLVSEEGKSVGRLRLSAIRCKFISFVSQ